MQDQQARQQARESFDRLTPDEKKCLISMLTEEYVVSFPYYSKVMFTAARAASPAASTYTIATGTQVRAFSYAYESGVADTAGFPAGYVATTADTNLAKPSETIAGEDVDINGIALQLVGAFPTAVSSVVSTNYLSDARLLHLLNDATAVSLRLNGSMQWYKLGIMSMLPGAGGILGEGNDTLGTQAIQGGRFAFGQGTNGWPGAGEFFAMPEGLVWQRSGKRDSMLQVNFEVRRPVIAYTGGSLASNAADEEASGGIRGYVYPAVVGVAIMVHLKGSTFAERSLVT